MEKLREFKELGVSERMLRALKKKGFEAPTPIQKKVIPLLLEGTGDIIGQAQTGTGKTAAFGIPLLEKLVENSGFTQALVLVPTRELAIQVSEELNSIKNDSALVIFPVYGGQSMEIQINKLRRNVDIIVGTPGRTLDLIRRKKIILNKISYLILDEADEMLSMGFIEDIELIMKNTAPEKKTLLFSATIPAPIKKIAQKYMRNSTHVSVNSSEVTTVLTEQIYFEVHSADRFEALCRIIDAETDMFGIIFCRTKLEVDEIAIKLKERGYKAEGLHGDISQTMREKILKKFRSHNTSILVATDVAARGIDITDLTHVINYSLPQDPDSYIHRIGRTGRAGKKGTAITFITSSEYRRLNYIKNLINADIRKKKLPAIAELITAKKAKIKQELERIIIAGEHQDYLDLASELTAENDPKNIVAALIEHIYDDEFKESSYREINDVSVDMQGKTRLFVALGKMDRMTPQSLAQFLAREGNIEPFLIKDIKVYDKFSFVTVPFNIAEKFLQVSNSRDKKRQRPLITKARPMK
ncbi:MAG: DEAD/DEAH box helicase [Candidatus Margulisbacteria bacterium]|nr:DEAD/DEAH box helicase [Candidatus Margulisiibacteriota bacterium]